MTSAARHRAEPALLLAAWSAMVDLVLPRGCGGCGRPGPAWCADCAGRLAEAPARQVLPGGLVVWSATGYDGPVRAAVVAWKDRGRVDLTRPLAVGLRRAATAALDDAAGGAALDPLGPARARDRGVLVLVPVPSSRRSRRARGREPVRELARGTATALRRRGRPVAVLPVLRQARRVADQAGLSAVERRHNLDGALGLRAGWRSRIEGRTVLLVDDVVTTGATLEEARRALAEAGADVRAAATVAATARHANH